MYLYQQDGWTHFTWDAATIVPLVGNARFAQGKLLGALEDVGFDLTARIEVDSLRTEVVCSSQIEGVQLDAAQVRSSVARRLGVEDIPETSDTRDVDGAVEIVLDATRNPWEPLSEDRLFGWHAALFPSGRSGLRNIVTGRYREGSMSVVSGPIGREKVRFVAPPVSSVPRLMSEFFERFNHIGDEEPLIQAGIFHLWFLTIHPFEDGNGRIARALTETLLCRSDGSPRRFYSMSNYIMKNRATYYDQIERAQKGTPDLTRWLAWFLGAVKSSAEQGLEEVSSVLGRSTFWRSIDSVPLNDRQRKVLSKLVGDFKGNLTAQKWARICKVSPDTALRDINDLIAKGVLVKNPAGGRSSSYSLADGRGCGR